jgi:hypothetical protein
MIYTASCSEAVSWQYTQDLPIRSLPGQYFEPIATASKPGVEAVNCETNNRFANV